MYEETALETNPDFLARLCEWWDAPPFGSWEPAPALHDLLWGARGLASDLGHAALFEELDFLAEIALLRGDCAEEEAA